ncbi:hypothetical protein LJB42_004855 [Komagataella kurtzmanii]|nr:hypothetical protein LJB42_004855 [Komagataella kurtzmanii]
MSKTKVDYSFNNPDVVTQYSTAGSIAAQVLKEVKAKCVEGAKTFDICVFGDNRLKEELEKVYEEEKKGKKTTSKGIAFPTSITPNNLVAYLSPTAAEDEANLELKKGDLIKVSLGAEIGGYPSIISETLVIEEDEVTGRKADVIAAAYYAFQSAIRTIRPGKRNMEVTKVVDDVAKAFHCVPVESMLSHNQERNILTGEKEIIINPTPEHRKQIGTFEFNEGEVYGLDILISSSKTGKVKKSSYLTSIFKYTGTSYRLKLKTSQSSLNQVKKLSPYFPVSLRSFADSKRGRMGLHECVSHQVVVPYDVVQEKEDELVAQFYATIGVGKDATVQLTPFSFDISTIKSEHSVSDESLLNLLAQPLVEQE